VDEAEWLACHDPNELLIELRRRVAWGRRKPRLVAAACLRQFWRLLSEEERRAVEVSECYADGQAKFQEMRGAGRQAEGQRPLWATRLVMGIIRRDAADALHEVLFRLPHWCSTPISWGEAQRALCDVICDVFGNPFRRPPPLPPEVLAWNDSTVRRLAQAMYDSGAFSHMGVLADALLDAGCADEDLLAHCRSGGEHVRGCWAVDLLLGKQ
jgi:hypothetical protein